MTTQTATASRAAMTLAHEIRRRAADLFECRAGEIVFAECLRLAWALTRSGASRWQRGTMDRFYFNKSSLIRITGLEFSSYKTGSISGAFLDDNDISNSQAQKLLGEMHSGKFWFDMGDLEFHAQGRDRRSVDRIVNALEALAA